MQQLSLQTSSTQRCATFLARCNIPVQRNPHRWSSVVCQASRREAKAWAGPPAVVVGAGIAGLATALALHKVGVPVQVVEEGPGLRNEGAAIALWSNAWRALDTLGVAQQLRSKYLALDRIELCRGESGKLLRGFGFSECNGGAGQEFRGVHRIALLETLASALPPDCITFNTEVQDVLPSSSTASGPAVRVAVRGWQQPLECGLLVGADGVRSTVARHLQLPPTNYAGYVAYRGVAKLSEQGAAAVGLPLDTIRQIWGAGTRAGMYPITKDEVYWYVCFNAPVDAPVPASPQQSVAEVLGAVKGWAWGLEQVVRSTPPETISRSRVADRWTRGAFGRGLVTLAGDAAHPQTPNLGQGGCTALEDAVVLAGAVSEAVQGSAGGVSERLEQALRVYEEERSARCLPLTVRANIMGLLLQLPYAPVCTVRDTFISSPLFSPSHFLDHTLYNAASAKVAVKAV